MTHWSAAGSINQCAEQSAPGLIQSPLQQNAAISTTDECVFTPPLCLYDLCVCASSPGSRRRPETNPPFGETEWEEEADREHYGEERCVKSVLPPLSEAEVQTRTMTAWRELSSSVEGVEEETKKWHPAEKTLHSVFPGMQRKCSFTSCRNNWRVILTIRTLKRLCFLLESFSGTFCLPFNRFLLCSLWFNNSFTASVSHGFYL